MAIIALEEKRPAILVVDDEPRILSALQRLLREEPYRLFTAGSGEEALGLLAAEAVDLVLSDLRMPGMDGFALMTHIQHEFPDIERVLMSGNADLRSVIDAVNNGLMSQFVEKPWIDGALKIVLRNRLEANQLAHKNAELLVAVQNQNALLAQESEKTLLEVRQKERLFATMSHEIRNPLHGIQGILEILSQDEDLKEETKNLLSTAITSSTFMRQILDDVLDYSKSEAGKVVLQEKAFSPVALVQDLAGLMRPLAQGKQLSLDVHFKSALEQQVFIGDDFRIRQILNNLVSNAIKYTEVGGIEITLRSEEALVIVVSDSGIGIPEEKRRGLFDAYTMVEDEHDRAYGGTGLGLTIVKNLTELMAGSIEVKANSQGGSEFTLRLPLKAAESNPKPAALADVSHMIAGMRVLVADDMAANRLIVEKVLSRYGAIVHTFAEGESLLRYLEESEALPDLLLLDINMPKLMGQVVLERIRQMSHALAKVPAFAMSASLDFEGSEQLVARFDGILSKPFTVGQLLGLAREYAPDRQDQLAGDDVPEPLGTADGLPESIDSQSYATPQIARLIAEMGDDLVTELLAAFRSSLSHGLEQLQVRDLRPEAVIDVAHSLKPTALTLGLTELAKDCQNLDRLRAPDQKKQALHECPALIDTIEKAILTVDRSLVARSS